MVVPATPEHEDTIELHDLPCQPERCQPQPLHSQQQPSQLSAQPGTNLAHSLFPEIVYTNPSDNSIKHRKAASYSNNNRLSKDLSDLTSVHSQNLVPIIDDTASSICLDDIDQPLEQMAKDIYNKSLKGVPSNPSLRRSHLLLSSHSNHEPASSIENETNDFEQYNRQTAAQILARKKLQRKHERQMRRRNRKGQEKKFGNYFSNPEYEYDSRTTLRVSYTVDFFNGQRQNELYNNQLNLMFAQSNNLQYTSPSNLTFNGNNIAVVSSGASFVTDIIDDMSSSDGRSIDGEDFYDYEFNLDSNNIPDYDSDFSDDENPRWIPYRGLQRIMMSRHLSSTAFAGSIGISSLLAMGQALFASGPLGSLIGFIIAGIVVYSSMTSYGEVASFLPLHNGIPGTVSRFLDSSLGIAFGFAYWFSNAIALPLELTSAAMMLTGYPELAEPEVLTVWIIVILVLVLGINMATARIYGDIQYIINIVRIFLFAGLTLFSIFLNRGLVGPVYDNVGFRYWQYSKSNFENGLIYGPFRPVLPIHLLFRSNQDEIDVWGIPGSIGRFLQVTQAIITAAKSYMSSSIVFASVGEARNPRRAVAKATQLIFFSIILFYVLIIFIFGITIYAGDSNLIVFGTVEDYQHIKNKNYQLGAMTTSVQTQHDLCFAGSYFSTNIILGFNRVPWIVALQTVGLCTVASVINALCVFFAISAGSAHLYSSSRTLYGLFRTLFENVYTPHNTGKIKWWHWPGLCNSLGVPLYAIFISFPFAFLAFSTTHTSSFRVFTLLMNIASSSAIIAWAGMALVFLRFYRAVVFRKHAADERNLENHSHSQFIIDRSDFAYPFRSRFQPFTAWLGFIGCFFLAMMQGYIVFLRNNWDPVDFISSYLSLFLFVTVYLVHKLTTGSVWKHSKDLDLDTGRREIERAEWVEDRKYDQTFWEWIRSKWSYVTGSRYHKTRKRRRRDSSLMFKTKTFAHDDTQTNTTATASNDFTTRS